MPNSSPIGFFDSGLGGISVLRETRKLLPCENYIYFGDSANAPYGEKSPEEIRALSDAAVRLLLERGAKAIVVACNTATGEAVDYLREKYPLLPIIGVEPAIKPAAEKHPEGRILVMATPQCLKSRRVMDLIARYRGNADVISVPCGGLMEFVERGEFHSAALRNYLTEKLLPFCDVPVSAAVLGCTHYPFLRRAIAEVLCAETELIDGNAGIAAQLARRLSEGDLLSQSKVPGQVELVNSSPDESYLHRSELLLNTPE